MSKRKEMVSTTLGSMTPTEINEAALAKLDELLNYATINLIAKLVGITRRTLYRWLDTDVAIDEMDHRYAAWFIIMCEQSPAILSILNTKPSRPRMAGRIIEDTEKH